MATDTFAETRKRARDFGIPFDGTPGPLNAITDIGGVHVGFSTIREETPRPGRKLPVRTGVTAILPHATADEPVPVFAGIHRFNGNGEMTGSHWIKDGGYFVGPVLITNTHSVGITHHGAVRWGQSSGIRSGHHPWHRSSGPSSNAHRSMRGRR